MTDDFDDQLRALFVSAEHDMPAETFTAGVTARIGSDRRRSRLLQGVGGLTIVVTLWLLAPDIARAVVAVAGFPTVVSGLAVRSSRTLVESSVFSVLCLYGGVFSAWLLLKGLRQLRVRWI
jgi:hypothetical protein